VRRGAEIAASERLQSVSRQLGQMLGSSAGERLVDLDSLMVSMPRSPTPAAPPVQKPSPEPVIVGGDERVLLIEDNPSLRRLTRLVLERHGYRVTEGASGFAAMAALDETGDRIDLVLTDVIVPDISGPEVANRVRSRFPGAATLCISGYTDDDVLRHGLLHSSAPFLQKPFTAEALTSRIREVLDVRA
ncbi:MAG: response regulator, partial [Longimicrobiales bacterium]